MRIKFKSKRLLTIIAGFVCLTQIVYPLPHTAQAHSNGISMSLIDGSLENKPPVQVPSELGNLAEMMMGDQDKPVIMHIQAAHGLYEAEKNIEALLHHFRHEYGFDLLFLEGGAGELDARYFDLFPQRPDLNLKVADILVRRAEMTGPELFLLDKRGAGVQAYGIEDEQTYQENRRDFQSVLQHRGQTARFLQEMTARFNELTAARMNSSLRNLLALYERHENGRMDLAEFLDKLGVFAKKHLEIDFEDAFHQKNWPMLIRFFRLRKIEGRMNHSGLEKEKKSFIENISHFKLEPSLLTAIKEVLVSGSESLRVRKIFEDLFDLLPRSYNFSDYPQLRIWLQAQILQSEMRTDVLFDEIDRLKGQLADQLAVSEADKSLYRWMRDFRLLKKLFALELNRGEYESLSRRRGVHPEILLRRLRRMDASALLYDKSGHNLTPSPLSSPLRGEGWGEAKIVKEAAILQKIRFKTNALENCKHIVSIYLTAKSFYNGAHGREIIMGEKIEKEMRKSPMKPSVVVTGGFHAEGIREYFESRGYSYVLITPRMTEIPRVNPYWTAMLEDGSKKANISQIANIIKLQPIRRIAQQSPRGNEYVRYYRENIRQALKEAGIGEKEIQSALLLQRSAGSSDYLSFILAEKRESIDSRLKPATKTSAGPSVMFGGYSGMTERVHHSNLSNSVLTVVQMDSHPLRPSPKSQFASTSPLEERGKSERGYASEVIEQKKSARFELRTSKEELDALRKTFFDAPEAGSSPLNFKRILEILDGAVKRNNRGLQAEALNLAGYFIAHNPALRYELGAYEESVKTALVQHHNFASDIAAVNKRGDAVELEKMVRLGVKIIGEQDDREIPSLREDLFSVAEWAVEQGKLNNATQHEIFVNYDTGALPSQIDRGKFIALFFRIANIPLYPYFPSLDEMEMEGDQWLFLRRYADKDGSVLSYILPFSSGVMETEETLERDNMVVYEAKRLREIQLLNLGLFLASAEESYQLFFPNQKPSWMDERMQAVGLAYRTFERRFVAFLRKYDSLLDPARIERLGAEPEEKHQARQHAARQYLLEEVLYAAPWLYGSRTEMVEAWNRDFLPRLRTLEAMLLRNKDGIMDLGLQFIEDSEQMGDEYLILTRAILWDKNFTLARIPAIFRDKEVDTDYANTFQDARQFSNPFMDLRSGPGQRLTPRYLHVIAEGLTRGNISLADIPDSARVGTALKFRNIPHSRRSELRSPNASLERLKIEVERDPLIASEAGRRITRGAIRFSRQGMEGILDDKDPAYEFLYKILFRSHRDQRKTAGFERRLNAELGIDRDDQSRNAILQQMKQLLSGDSHFAVVTLPLPRNITGRTFLTILREFQPLIRNHPRKILAISYEGALPEAIHKTLAEDYDHRLFIFEDSHENVLKGLHSGDFSNFQRAEERTQAKNLFARAFQLRGAPLKAADLGQSSLVVGDEANFERLTFPTGKQFLNRAITGLSSMNLFRAQLLYGLGYSSVNNAELLKQIPDELTVQGNEDTLRLSFKPDFASDIKHLLQAVQSILQSA